MYYPTFDLCTLFYIRNFNYSAHMFRPLFLLFSFITMGSVARPTMYTHINSLPVLLSPQVSPVTSVIIFVVGN